MKTRLLMIIAISIFVTLIAFVGIVYSINLEMKNMGPIDYDPDLSPSYVPYYHRMLEFDSIFVAGPIMLGLISLTFIIPNIILRVKKIPTRKYMLIIGAGVLFFFGFSSIQNGIGSLLTVDILTDESNMISFVGGLIPIGIGLVFVIPAIILLKRVKLRVIK